MQLDSATSALLGAVIGGIIGVGGTVITAWAASRRELRAFRRARSQQHIDRVRETYELALNVFFNINRSGNPDRATYGDTFARVSLHGAPEVRHILDDYLAASPSDKKLDVQRIVQAMKTHLNELEGANE